jgi:hypothetical protein
LSSRLAIVRLDHIVEINLTGAVPVQEQVQPPIVIALSPLVDAVDHSRQHRLNIGERAIPVVLIDACNLTRANFSGEHDIQVSIVVEVAPCC